MSTDQPRRWLLVLQGPSKGRVMLFGDRWAEAHMRDGRARPLRKSDWPLKTTPIAYLEKDPQGEHARLAGALINAGVY